ncbi:siderophore-interacting protein [Fodinicola acaciae]|uniref:siderophore-interacting protein n=1 Tax=Fodinicola acaciae TaxID=2681555 RepID=UPI0013D1A6F3|nr:siderophore-interacting protein [Fodinicola acaciae]
MADSGVAAPSPTADAYRMFSAHVVDRQVVTPHMARITFGGDLDGFTTVGIDHRIKLFFPLPGQDAPEVPTGSDWYQRYRAMPAAVRPPMRTYTIRNHRPEAGEVDVDFVLHGDTGPASSWAGRARAGDRVVICGPNAAVPPTVGYEYRPVADSDWRLIVGDETALPAISGILESFGPDEKAMVFVEVPEEADVQPLATRGDVSVTWLPRHGAGDGVGLSLRRAVTEASFPNGRPYAWLAGESSTVTALRRHLVRERKLDKQQVTFLGYWRRGGPIE